MSQWLSPALDLYVGSWRLLLHRHLKLSVCTPPALAPNCWTRSGELLKITTAAAAIMNTHPTPRPTKSSPRTHSCQCQGLWWPELKGHFAFSWTWYCHTLPQPEPCTTRPGLTADSSTPPSASGSLP